MPKFKDRECSTCKNVLKNTATRSAICLSCQKKEKKERDIDEEFRLLGEWGYSVITGPVYDKFNHRCYKVLTPCDHEWEAPFTNILKQVKNAKSKGLRDPCGFCGPKNRFSGALKKYIEKYGIDYDLTKANEYRRKVRGLSEVTYRHHKSEINPLNLKRGHWDYHLDHKIPIIECFKQGWTPEQAAHVTNLQMLTCGDNLSKGSK